MTPLNTCGKKYFSDIPTQVNRNAASDFLKILVNLRCGMDAKCPFYYINDLRFLISSSQTTCGMNFFVISRPKLTEMRQVIISTFFNFKVWDGQEICLFIIEICFFFSFHPPKVLAALQISFDIPNQVNTNAASDFFYLWWIKCMVFVGNVSFIINM